LVLSELRARRPYLKEMLDKDQYYKFF